MARHAGRAKNTVENCLSIDVLDWHRRGFLRSPRQFSWTWNWEGERVASISVQTERHSITLKYRGRSGEDWSDVAQRIPIVWTPCRFGSERPWLVCAVASDGVYCGRRVIKMYVAGRMFACRQCYGLVYASQQETVSQRGRRKAQKIRMRLGGSPSMMDDFPDRPRGMHEQTFERWRRIHDAAEERSTNGLIRFVELLGRRISRRAS
jgi:hypothetical protein